ncbi:MAG TPA: hypothetical protein DCE41_32130 [Cytophagales bacterium]|nr:hypothetical protein [Cytophagales bacterium]HAP58899.1 hypothetical protein [Cytophagales bacterium]
MLRITLHSGELTLIIGPSGSGKTTVLSLLVCVIYPTGGDVVVNRQLISSLSQKKLAKLRLDQIGFVLQSFNWVAPLNAE